eukprot:m.490674 g.490674  ORF g.490674 m.490674 type:complete len:516 (-) comp21782_c0_seq3:244-1791(-)
MASGTFNPSGSESSGASASASDADFNDDGWESCPKWGPSLRKRIGIIGHTMKCWRAGADHKMFRNQDRALVRTILLVAMRIRQAYFSRDLHTTPPSTGCTCNGKRCRMDPESGSDVDCGGGSSSDRGANIALEDVIMQQCPTCHRVAGTSNRAAQYTPPIPALPSEIWYMIIRQFPIRPAKYKTVVVAGSRTHAFLDGIGTQALFNHPSGIAIDNSGNVVVCDSTNHRIRKFNPRTGAVTTLAGSGEPGHRDGNGQYAMFHHPKGICCREEDGMIIVTDHDTCCIRAVHPETGHVSTLSGLNLGDESELRRPTGVAAGVNSEIIVADYFNNRVCGLHGDGSVVGLTGGPTQPYIGHRDGDSSRAQWRWPMDVDVDVHGNIIVADSRNHVVRLVRAQYPGRQQMLHVSDIAPDASAKIFGERGRPRGVALDGAGNIVVSDVVHNFVAMIHAGTGMIEPLAGNVGHFLWDAKAIDTSTMAHADFSRPRGVAIDAKGNVYVADSHSITKIHAGEYAFA